MIKNRLTIGGITVAISLTLALVIFPLLRQQEDLSPLEPAQETSAAPDLGITYLRITPALSTYYDLGVDSGVLVTEVMSGSSMDRASVQVGDVIYSCNGVKLDEGVSLLGMMREYRPGDTIILEVCRGEICRSVECCQGCGTPGCTCNGSTINDK